MERLGRVSHIIIYCFNEDQDQRNLLKAESACTTTSTPVHEQHFFLVITTCLVNCNRQSSITINKTSCCEKKKPVLHVKTDFSTLF